MKILNLIKEDGKIAKGKEKEQYRQLYRLASLVSSYKKNKKETIGKNEGEYDLKLLTSLEREVNKELKFNCAKISYDQLLKKEEFVVLDFETTGFAPASIVEIGAIKFKEDCCGNFKPISSFHTLINPERKIQTSARKIHKITDEMLKDAPTIYQAFEEFMAYINGTTIVAQNASFEEKIIKCAIKEVHPYLDIDSKYNLEFFDTLNIFRKEFSRLKSRSLSFLMEVFDIDLNSHRALDDVKATASILLKVIKGEHKEILKNCPSKHLKNKKDKKKESKKKKDNLNSFEKMLFKKFKRIRLNIAEKLEEPAFKICHDKDLINIIKSKPKEKKDMIKLKGMGDKKFEKIGKTLLPYFY